MDTIPARELTKQALGRAIAATWPSYWLYCQRLTEESVSLSLDQSSLRSTGD
jgi:hypothetical protein